MSCLKPLSEYVILYLFVYDRFGSPIAQSVEPWTCDWKVAGSNP